MRIPLLSVAFVLLFTSCSTRHVNTSPTEGIVEMYSMCNRGGTSMDFILFDNETGNYLVFHGKKPRNMKQYYLNLKMKREKE